MVSPLAHSYMSPLLIGVSPLAGNFMSGVRDCSLSYSGLFP